MRTDDRTEEQVQIMRAQRGDASAFQSLLERCAPTGYALALGMTGDASSAEQALASAALSLWKTLPSFPLDESLSSRLYLLILLAAAEIPPPAPRKKTELPENREEALLSCLGQLSENHRAILLLSEIGGLNWAEIGQALQLTPGTAESRCARAETELQAYFSAITEKISEPPSEETWMELLHRISPLPPGFPESLCTAAAGQPQDLPFTNLPQNRDLHAAQRGQLKAWRKPVLIVAALVACFLLILGLGRLAQSIGSSGAQSPVSSEAQRS